MFQHLRAERGERGFTLVELLVVIAILGILAGVVVFSVSGISDTGQSAACRTEASIVRTAEEAFKTNDTSHVYTDFGTLKTKGYLGTAPTLVTLGATSPSYPGTFAWAGTTCSGITPAITP